MFAVRFIALALIVAFSWSMGQIPANEINAFGKLVSSLFFLAAPALYFLPIFEARLRKHKNLSAIALVNIFLGWTLIGWVFSLVWAFKKDELIVALDPIKTNSQSQNTKNCPYCAEEIFSAAIKCKHCGSVLSDSQQTI